MPDDPLKPERKCGSCTACCEGWLNGEVYGHKFNAGLPCHFLGAGRCTIYDHRPEEPCQNYQCVWLYDHAVPEWMQPNRCGVILTGRRQAGIEWIEAREAGKQMDSKVLSWLIQQVIVKGKNLHYQVSGAWNFVGSSEFFRLLNG